MIAKIPQTSNIKGSFLNFSAQGGWGKEKILMKSAEKIGLPSEGGSAGGFKGECRAARAEAQPRRPVHQNRAEQKNVLFLLEEKIQRA